MAVYTNIKKRKQIRERKKRKHPVDGSGSGRGREEGEPAGKHEIGALVGGDVLVEGEGVADEVEEEVPREKDGGAALVELELELAGAGGWGGLGELVPLRAGGGGGGGGGHVAVMVTPDDIEDLAADLRARCGNGTEDRIESY